MGKWIRLLWLGLLFWLSALTAVSGAVILYNHDEGESYGRILSERGAKVQGIPSSQLLHHLPEDDVQAVEAYDVQAAVLQGGSRASYQWYPQYTATVVLAVSDSCPVPVTGWQSLSSAPLSLAVTGTNPARLFFIQAMSYGLKGDLSGRAGVELLRQLQEDGRLSMEEGENRPSADVYVLFDYQVREWQRQGIPVHPVVPEEGTLAFRKGLLAKESLSFDSQKLSEALEGAGYALSPPPGARFVSDAEAFLQAGDDIPRQITNHVFKSCRPTILTGFSHMVWYTVTLFFVILWGGRLRRQVLQPQVRRAYLGVIITLCCWILFREIKLSLPDFMNDGIRYIWYSYYLFYGILISFLLWIGYSASYAFLTRPCPRWMKGIFAGNLLLAFLVMTNDFHQLVFTLPAGLAAAYSRHGYGPLYFILAAVYGMELLAVNGVLCYTSLSRKVSHPARMILPLAVVVGYGIYVVGYALPGSPFQPSELVLVTIWTVLLWLELVTRGKFVPANEGYIDFFRHSSLAMQLYDHDGHLVYASSGTAPLRGEDFEVQSMPISGGLVRWYRDVGPLRRRQALLERLNQDLNWSYELLSCLSDIRRQAIEQGVTLRVYRELEEIIARKQPAIRHRLAYLKTAKPGPHTDAVIGRLHILACYLKKRCILLLQGKEAGMLDARELAMAVEESWRYLEKAGLRGSVGFDLKGNLPVQAALTLYDIFEDVGEEVLARGEAFWLCRFKETEKDWIFSVVLEEKEGETRPASWQALSDYDVSVQCDDTGYGTRLTVRLSRESTDSFT